MKFGTVMMAGQPCLVMRHGDGGLCPVDRLMATADAGAAPAGMLELVHRIGDDPALAAALAVSQFSRWCRAGGPGMASRNARSPRGRQRICRVLLPTEPLSHPIASFAQTRLRSINTLANDSFRNTNLFAHHLRQPVLCRLLKVATELVVDVRRVRNARDIGRWRWKKCRGCRRGRHPRCRTAAQ